MEALTIIVVTVFAGICTALFTKLYLFVIGNPNEEEVNTSAILSFIGLWLNEKYTKRQGEIMNLASQGKTIEEGERIESRQKNIYKALGVCPYCFNVYPSLITGIALWYYDIIPLICSFAIASIAHYTLGKILE